MTNHPADPRRPVPPGLDANRADSRRSLITIAVLVAVGAVMVILLGTFGQSDRVDDTAAVTEPPADPTVMRNEEAPSLPPAGETGAVAPAEPDNQVVTPQAPAAAEPSPAPGSDTRPAAPADPGAAATPPAGQP